MGTIPNFKGMIDPIAAALPDDKKHLEKEIEKMFSDSMKARQVVDDESSPPFKICPPFNSEVVSWTKKHWQPRDDDVIIVSFMKTGTTWNREIMRRILYKDDETAYKTSRLFHSPQLGYLESGSAAKYDVIESVRSDRWVWATHLFSELLDVEKLLKTNAKIIYPIRNPKDVMISIKKFIESMPWMRNPNFKKHFPDDIAEFTNSYIEGKLPVYTKEGEWYPHHIRSWMKYKDHPNFHYVFYEDLIQNPSKEIQKICEHVGVKLNRDELEAIVEQTSFDSMKKAAEKAPSVVKMFRKGGVGGWKSFLSEDLSMQIETKFNRDIGDLDLNFTYEL